MPPEKRYIPLSKAKKKMVARYVGINCGKNQYPNGCKRTPMEATSDVQTKRVDITSDMQLNLISMCFFGALMSLPDTVDVLQFLRLLTMLEKPIRWLVLDRFVCRRALVKLPSFTRFKNIVFFCGWVVSTCHRTLCMSKRLRCIIKLRKRIIL